VGIEIVAHSDCLAILELNHRTPRGCDIRPTFRPKAPECTDYNDSIAKVLNLRDQDLDFVEQFVQVLEHLADTLMPSINGRLPSKRDVKTRMRPFRLRVNEREERVEVAPVERVKGAMDPLDVLLRHRPRSISLRPQGRQCHGRHEYQPISIGLALPPLRVELSGR
jgi:hypothetical protein